MSEVIHGSLITGDGLNALANAKAQNGKIYPATYKFSSQDLELDPTLHASDIIGWHTGNIDVYLPIDNDTTQFTCIAEPHEAIDYMRICALFLEDGTLFALSKPPFPFPPTLRQRENIQIKFQNIQEVMDYKFVSFDETEQDLSLLNSTCVLGSIALKNSAKLNGIKY